MLTNTYRVQRLITLYGSTFPRIAVTLTQKRRFFFAKRGWLDCVLSFNLAIKHATKSCLLLLKCNNVLYQQTTCLLLLQTVVYSLFFLQESLTVVMLIWHMPQTGLCVYTRLKVEAWLGVFASK